MNIYSYLSFQNNSKLILRKISKLTYGSPGSVLEELREDVVQRDLDIGEHGRGVSGYLNG